MDRDHSLGAVVELRDVGLLPFTAVGFLILLLAVGVIAHHQLSTHRSHMKFVNDSAANTLVTDMASRLNDLEREARNSLYDALWRAGKNAYKFESEEDQQNTIKNWASLSFQGSLSSLAREDENSTHRYDLKLGRGTTSFQLEPYGDGYPLASIKLPENTEIFGSLPDNGLSLSLPIEKLETSVDVRYYLLRNRMESFRTNMKAIKDIWKYSEYGTAYVQAWMLGRVDIDESRSCALFQLAWASHELSSFGSSDYLATATSITGFSWDDLASSEYETSIVVEPLKEEEIGRISGKLDKSIGYLEDSSRKLKASSDKAGKLGKLELEVRADKILGRLAELSGQIDNLDPELAKQKFLGICEDSRSIYSYPSRKISEILKEIRRAEKFVRDAKDRFQSALDLMEELGEDNPLLKRLSENLTEGGRTSERVRGISEAFDVVLSELEDLEGETLTLRDELRVSGLDSIFPGEFPEKFSKALEENIDRVERILSNARNSAEKAFASFELKIEEKEEEVDRFCLRLSRKVEDLTRIPKPNQFEKFEEYPEPGEDFREPPVTRTVEKYVLREGEETIGGLERALEEIETGLDHLTDLSKKFESERGELHEFVVEGGLKEALAGGIEHRLPLKLDRERSYEISPPKPLRDKPGISVYHETEVKDVHYTRMDPLGWVHPKAPPTPIYIWPLGVTLYWAMWDVQIELEEPVVEEIFDYKNQVIPRPLAEGSDRNFEYVHKPLAYRWELNKKEFSFPLVIISLREFVIS